MFLHPKRRIYSVFPISLLLISFLVSCVTAPPPEKGVISPEKTLLEVESSRQVRAMNERILMGSLSSQRDPYRDYKIGPEDLLEISVFEAEKLNQTVRVSSQGNISLPLLGVVRVRGLTANHLERELRELLAEKYLQDPHVSVFIKEYRSQRISVMGAVEKPGVFEVTGQKTILDMLAMAGGLRADAQQQAGSLLFLIRPPAVQGEAPEALEGEKDDEAGGPQTFVIDLEELLVEGDVSLNVPLIHGDLINIPTSGKVFVGGEVWRPGGFPLGRKRMTLTQAIIMAAGLKPQANGSETMIFRCSERGVGKEILSVNVYAIQKGQGEDPYLKENDIIIVPRHGVKAFFVGLRDTLRGIFSMGYSLGSL